MSKHAKTLAIVEAAREALGSNRPMTVRQVYYQLVSRQVIENNRSAYQAVSKALVWARQEGHIPWDWIEDRLRRPRTVSMWDDPKAFAATAKKAYRRDVWATQPRYLEVWLEKDALSGIFEDVLRPYGVTLNVGRGYDGWSSIRNAALRYEHRTYDTGQGTTILYFGDFDPSGEDMVRSLEERLRTFAYWPEIRKVALTADDIDDYSLPPDPAKLTDTRSAAFVAEHGDVSVELDALPVDVLRQRLTDEVESLLVLKALRQVQKKEAKERKQIAAALEGLA
jgi:hypothetical protein